MRDHLISCKPRIRRISEERAWIAQTGIAFGIDPEIISLRSPNAAFPGGRRMISGGSIRFEHDVQA